MYHPLITLTILGLLILPGHSQQSPSTSGIGIDPKLLLAQPQTTKDKWNLKSYDGQAPRGVEDKWLTVQAREVLPNASDFSPATRFPGMVPTMEMILDLLEAQKKIATILETQVKINQDLLVRVKRLEFHGGGTDPVRSQAWIMSGEPSQWIASDPSNYISVVIPGGQIMRWNLAEANSVLVSLAREINRISKNSAKTTGTPNWLGEFK